VNVLPRSLLCRWITTPLGLGSRRAGTAGSLTLPAHPGTTRNTASLRPAWYYLSAKCPCMMVGALCVLAVVCGGRLCAGLRITGYDPMGVMAQHSAGTSSRAG